jgi:hypothetical protein
MNPDAWAVAYCLLATYCLAGALMEHFAVFSGWAAVGDDEFTTVHTAQGNGVGYVYVLPKSVLTGYLIVMLAAAPRGAPSGLLVASLILLSTSWLSTAFVQLPIQRRIRRQPNPLLVVRLRRTDLIRVAVMTAHSALAVLVVADVLAR